VVVLPNGKRKVFAINPMAAARCRDRHSSVSRKKSDPGDALVLANILRTDMHAHRTLPEHSDLGRATDPHPDPGRAQASRPPVRHLSAYGRMWPWQDFREAGVCHRAPVTLRHG
jgi:hypothetical protein